MEGRATFARYKNRLILLLAAVMLLCICGFLTACQNKKEPGTSDEFINEPIRQEDVFHDIGEPYVSHIEPTDADTMTVRLRVRHGNITEAALVYTSHLEYENSADCAWETIKMSFEKTDASGYYDYYICDIPPQPSAYRYYFTVKNNVDSAFYSLSEFGRNESNAPEKISSGFLAQVNFTTPDWSKGLLWYSAMPDSFFNGEVFSDKYGGSIEQNIWGLLHDGGLDYFGGDLFGLYEKTDYFEELNVGGVYINPIWLANHNAGYGGLDLTNLDTTFGSEDMLQKLIDSLHSRNMKFMMDGVFAFLADASVYVNTNGLWITDSATDQSSKYYSVFVRDANGNIQSNQFGPIVDFGKQAAQELIYSSQDSVMQYYLREFGLDGWRLDSSVLFGGTNTNGTQIIQDMRKYMKQVAPDSLLCIENASASTMYTDYAADTYWSQEFLAGIRRFAQNEVTADSLQSLMENSHNTVVKLPRATGLALYLISADHDTLRLLDYTGGDVEKAMSIHLLLMTYMGAPSLYYGEEIGMVSDSDHSFFKAMNWDRSTWNYDIYNQIKALSQFRAENEALFKYGILENMGVDETNLLLKYRRSYGETQMLTVLNPTGEVKSGVEIDVHSMEIKDGEKVYDYLSGNSYTVSGGKVTVTVMPYGMLLTNKSGNAWAGKWEISGSGTGSVRQTGAASYAVEGEGSMSKNRYAQMPIYNNAGLELSAEGNVIAVMQSAKEGGNYYGVEIRGTEVIVKAKNGGTEEEVTRFTIQAGEKLKIVRGDDNRFTVERNGEAVSGSEKYVEAGYEMYGGIGALSGSGSVNGLQITEEELQKGTEFESGSDSMMETKGEAGAAEIADGVLRLKGTESGVYRLTHAPMRDFSIKTELSGSPQAAGDAMGLTVWQSENCFIFAGRAFVDGKSKIVFAQSVNGTLMFQGMAEDVSGSIVLQLERTGANWTARYRGASENIFHTISTHMIANFSDMYAGVFNRGKGTAEYEYFCFGDAIHDGDSYSAHAGYGEISLDDVSFGSYGLVSYTDVSGSWEIANGGVKQTDKNAESAVYRTGQTLQYFRADYSIDFIETSSANAFVAFQFGSTAEDYSVRLYADGALKLMQGETALKETKLAGFDASAPTRIFIEYSDANVLTVLTGGIAEVAFSVPDFAASAGTLGWEGSRASFRLSSYQCQAYSDNYPVFGSVSAVDGDIYNPNSSMSVVSEGITDFVLSFDLAQFQRSKPADNIYFGFILGGSVGYGEACEGSMIIGMNLSKELFISVDGKKVASAQLSDALEIGDIHLNIVVQDKQIRIFAGAIGGDSEQVLEYTDSVVRGGAFTFESVNARTRIENVFIYGLQPGENYSEVIA